MSKLTPEQEIVAYLMDDNNYLPGHAEVVVSIEHEIWDLIENVYYKHFDRYTGELNANTAEDKPLTSEQRDSILKDFTWKMADYPWEETTPEIVVRVLTDVLNTNTAEEGLPDNMQVGGTKKVVEVEGYVPPQPKDTAEDVCPECGGDGIETCNNPDHSFIFGVGGEIGRLGCPVCGHDPEHKTGEICPTCEGESNANS